MGKKLQITEIQNFPKAELHCHLDGSIRPETLIEIANLQKMPISQDVKQVAAAMKAPQDCENLVEYLQCFDFVAPFLQTAEALELAAYDVMEQAFLDGVVYIEIRFAPTWSQEKGMTVEETILAVAAGISRAEKKYPVHGNILVCGMRQEAQEKIKDVFVRTQNLKAEKVVGIDLAGPELDDSVADLSETFTLVMDQSPLSLTLHAGECGCVENVLDSIAHGAQRIGHGIAVAADDQAQKVIAKAQVCIEGCPTSNLQTKAIDSIADYPVREWLQNGVIFCLNTDNRTVSDTTLTKEYHKIVTTFDLSFAEFVALNKNAVQAAFAQADLKKQLLEQMTTAEKAQKA